MIKKDRKSFDLSIITIENVGVGSIFQNKTKFVKFPLNSQDKRLIQQN